MARVRIFTIDGGSIDIAAMDDLDAMGLLEGWTGALMAGDNGVIALSLDDSWASHVQINSIISIDIEPGNDEENDQ